MAGAEIRLSEGNSINYFVIFKYNPHDEPNTKMNWEYLPEIFSSLDRQIDMNVISFFGQLILVGLNPEQGFEKYFVWIFCKSGARFTVFLYTIETSLDKDGNIDKKGFHFNKNEILIFPYEILGAGKIEIIGGNFQPSLGDDSMMGLYIITAYKIYYFKLSDDRERFELSSTLISLSDCLKNPDGHKVYRSYTYHFYTCFQISGDMRIDKISVYKDNTNEILDTLSEEGLIYTDSKNLSPLGYITTNNYKHMVEDFNLYFYNTYAQSDGSRLVNFLIPNELSWFNRYVVRNNSMVHIDQSGESSSDVEYFIRPWTSDSVDFEFVVKNFYLTKYWTIHVGGFLDMPGAIKT
jgi:hypothetical protein